MKRKLKHVKYLLALFLFLAFVSVGVPTYASPNGSDINGDAISLIYDYKGHYKLNYTGNTNQYDYWNDNGTSRIVNRNYKDRTDIATNNNSTATISKTDSESQIVKAYLIWETRSGSGVNTPICLYTPNSGTDFYAVPAEYACKDTRTNSTGEEYTCVYSMAADVTDIVQAAGYGDYTVANIPIWQGVGSGVACGGESVASWQLVIVEESPNFPLKTVSLSLLSRYCYNADYQVSVGFADVSSPNGVVTGQMLNGIVDIDGDWSFDGIASADDYNYVENGHYFRYKTQTRGLYKNGVSFNSRDTGTLGCHGSNAIGGVRMHLYDDTRRGNNVKFETLTYYLEGTNKGLLPFLYGASIDIYAYDVTFNGNGATSGSMDDVTYIYGRDYTLPENQYSKQYYEFVGWNTKADGSGTSYINKESVKNLTSTEQSVTLYAQWKPKGYRINLDNQYATEYGTAYFFEWYGKGNYTDSNCMTAISKITMPKKANNSFGGYYTEKNGKGTLYIDAEGKILSTSTTFDSETTLYAYWTPNTYKIILNNQGATTAGTKEYYQKYDVGNYTTKDCTTTISKITKPTKTHYTFGGYFTEANGKGQNIIDSDGKIVDVYTLFTKDTTIYAYWEPVTYTITLDNQNATNVGTRLYYEKYGVANYIESQTIEGLIGSKTVTFNYTGGSQAFIAPFDGTYQLVAYGAAGEGAYKLDSSNAYGFGARVDGNIELKKGEILWVYVGGKGNGTTGGYNGGGNGGTILTSSLGEVVAYGGGGATDFRKDGTDLTNRIMVAGGGGGKTTIANHSRMVYGGFPFNDKGKFNSFGINMNVNTNTVVTPNFGSVISPSENSAATAGAGSSCDYNAYHCIITRFYKGTLGQGVAGGGGGYYGGGFLTFSSSSTSFASTNGEYVLGASAGSSYNKGVLNGRYFRTYDGKYYRDNQSFDAINLGNGSATVTYDDYSVTTELKEATAIEIPQKTGYTFMGYFTGYNGTGTQVTDARGNITVSTDYFTANTTVYAYWIAGAVAIPDTYVVHFNGNGATSGSMSSMVCNVGQTYQLHANAFIRENYAFAGWAVAPTGGVTYANAQQFNQSTFGLSTGGSITLYAVWKPIEYTIRFNGNGATSGSMTDMNCTYGQTYTLPEAAYKKDGYYFAKWTTNPDGSGTAYADKVSVKNLTTAENGIVTLYAQWEANSYTIVFHPNDGAEVTHIGDITVKYGDIITVPDMTLPDGTYYYVKYTLDGVNVTEQVLSKAIVLSADGTVVYQGEPLTEGSGVANDGTITYPDGTMVSPNGIITSPDGIVTYPDGNVVYPDETDTEAQEEAEEFEESAEENGAQTATVTVEVKEVSRVGNPEDEAAEQTENREEEPQPDKKAYASVFRGWSLEEGKADFEPQWKPGNEIEVSTLINAAGVTNQNGATITLYAVWDDCPWITATHLYYTLEQAQSGFITDAEILSHATAYDREDGSPITAGFHDDGTSFSIPDYATADFTQFQHEGSCTENLTVVDSAGSVYSKQITVYIVDTTPAAAKPEGTTRFIDEYYYNQSYENGGLEENSIWLKDSEYVSVIRETFDNINNDKAIMTYYLTHDEILEWQQSILSDEAEEQQTN